MTRWSQAVAVLTAVVDGDYPTATAILADTDAAVVALRLAEIVHQLAEHERSRNCGHGITEVLQAYGLGPELRALEADR